MRKRRIILAASAAIGLAGALAAPPAMAHEGATENVTWNGTQALNGWHFGFQVTYTCGVDGAVTFTGTGGHLVSPSGHTSFDRYALDGALDTVNNTWAANVTQSPAELVYGATGTIDASVDSGTIPLSGWMSDPALSFVGAFADVPECAPAPVAGDHGKLVNDAVKAGVRGKELAGIASGKGVV